MNANQIINMVIRIVMRKLLRSGVNAGMDAVTKRMNRGGDDSSDKVPGGDDASQRSKQTMRMIRRLR